jgi:hypothetical protein
MQFTNLFFSLLLTTVVAAKGKNETKGVTDKTLCKEMASLTKLVDLAANTTKLDAKEKNNATKIAEIQAKASTAGEYYGRNFFPILKYSCDYLLRKRVEYP